ncbi:MAG TPA: hypothetical protein VGN72_21410 [Tepidisphaeraceae bacterium]|jgi:hypothetical protein|nr:hypothetical protein [Tepidisphaeraceae bacterium]
MQRNPLDYESPNPRPSRSRINFLPYAVFFSCAGISATFAGDAMKFQEDIDCFALVFFGLGAIVLPLLLRDR